MTTIDDYINTIIEKGGHAAHDDGSTAIEAHHLLLAIASEEETTTRQVLASAGLDRRAILAALDREFEHSLNAAGVSATAFDLPRPTRAAKPAKQLGASAKLALERGFTAASRKKDLRPAHLLLGILEAQVGTVPRALALADVDRTELVARLQALTPPST
jgi:ATP-dependent Clp protease ATP-binding subunit ClpA